MKEQIWLMNVKYFRFSTLHGHYTHVCIVSKVIDINTENKMSAKQGIHKSSLMIKRKYDCQMHSIMGDLYVHYNSSTVKHICNVGGIFVQGIYQ